MQTFITELKTRESSPNNYCKPLNLSPAGRYKYITLKLVFGEHIWYIKTKINIR